MEKKKKILLIFLMGFLLIAQGVWSEDNKFELMEVPMTKGSNMAYEDPGVALTTDPFWGGRARTANGELLEPDDFFKPETCKKCHEKIYNQWKGSMHSNSWNDPVFQAAVKLAAKEVGEALNDPDKGQKAVRMCLGCHTGIGVVTGGAPPADGSNLSEVAKNGVQCDLCHNVVRNTGIANNAYVLSPGRVKYGPRRDAEDNSFHKNQYSELHTKSNMCGMCHNVTHPMFGMPIERTYTEWKESPYFTKGIQCQNCHMYQTPTQASTGMTPRTPIPGSSAEWDSETGHRVSQQREHVHTHYFVGGNAVITSLLGANTHAELAKARLQSAATLIIEPPGRVQAGELTKLKVRVINSGAGHKLPTGFPEGRQMWLDVTVKDAKGSTIYRSGALDKNNMVTDPDAKIYKVHFAEEAKPLTSTYRLWLADRILHDNRIVPTGYDDTIYTFLVPKNASSGPLDVEVKLRYQSFSQDVANYVLGKGAPIIPAIDMNIERAKIEVTTQKVASAK